MQRLARPRLLKTLREKGQRDTHLKLSIKGCGLACQLMQYRGRLAPRTKREKSINQIELEGIC